MLKVLVVDDEKLVRQMIMRCIDWTELGLEIIGEASSARMGMELIEMYHPELVFMDVRMPGMDGLECSRKLLEKYPGLKIVIVSGYGEFEYASEGIRIGVFDYLLKPIQAEELEKAAIKARDAIREEQKNSETMIRLKKELDRHAGYIRDRQLGALVRGRYSAQMLETLDYFGVTFTGSVFQVAVINIAEREYASEEELLLLRMQAKQLAEDFYVEHKRLYVFDSGTENIILLNNEEESLFYESGEKLREYLEGNVESRVSIGVGDCYGSLALVSESYKEAKDALKYRFLSGVDGLLYFRDIYPYYDTPQGLPQKEELIHELGNALRIGSGEQAIAINGSLMEIFRSSRIEKEQALIVCLQIFAEIMRCLTELHIENEESGFYVQEELSKILELNSLEQIRKRIETVLLRICEVTGSHLAGKEKSLIGQVKEYLQEHYAEETLSLNYIAEQLYVNPSYLSRIFKEKTGGNFSTFLFQLRMEQAVRLVKGSELKVYEIGERIGIPDPHYFSSCFKKYTGMSVSEYRRGVQ